MHDGRLIEYLVIGGGGRDNLIDGLGNPVGDRFVSQDQGSGVGSLFADELAAPFFDYQGQAQVSPGTPICWWGPVWQ